jgi:hypothetical protein
LIGSQLQVFLQHAQAIFDLFRRIILNRGTLLALPTVGTAAAAARAAARRSAAELRERFECCGNRK